MKKASERSGEAKEHIDRFQSGADRVVTRLAQLTES